MYDTNGPKCYTSSGQIDIVWYRMNNIQNAMQHTFLFCFVRGRFAEHHSKLPAQRNLLRLELKSSLDSLRHQLRAENVLASAVFAIAQSRILLLPALPLVIVTPGVYIASPAQNSAGARSTGQLHNFRLFTFVNLHNINRVVPRFFNRVDCVVIN